MLTSHGVLPHQYWSGGGVLPPVLTTMVPVLYSPSEKFVLVEPHQYKVAADAAQDATNGEL